MRKLSKRAISTFVIAIFLLSTITSILPISYATHTSTATVDFTYGASRVIGLSSSLDVIVTNVGTDPISTVVIDFTGTGFTLTGEGVEPGAWTGVAAAGVVTYTGDTIASSASVTFVPVVTNPVIAGVAINPVVKTSDLGVKATLTTGTAGTNAISYVADTPGSAGNGISIAYVDPGAISQPLTVTVVINAISISLATDDSSVITSIASEVVAAISADADAAALVDASTTDIGTMVAMVATALSGGIEPTTNYLTLVTGTLTIVLPPLKPGFSIDWVTPGDVVYGQVLTVMGSGVTAGNVVNVYWDYVTASGKLNTTTGLSSGDFECTVKVPSAVYGDHYIWAIDAASGTPAKYGPLSVVSKIKLSPSSGLKGDNVIVKGYGFSETSDIDIEFGTLSDATGIDKTDSLGYFEYSFKVKDVIDGKYPVTATDEDTHSTSADFTVGVAITLDKTVGPAGTVVKVDGRGFTPSYTIVNNVGITLDTEPVSTKDGKDIITSSTGTFTAYLVIPSVSKGEYKITINGGPAKVATATFEVDGETK